MIHANAYRDTLMLLSDEIELVGFYDPNPDAVRPNLKPDAQQIPFYNTLEELLDQADLDAVMVSTYLRDMPDWMLQVAEAGVHLWADKPFAVHSSKLLPVAEAVERNNLQFSCGYSWRFHPMINQMKSAYDSGLLGNPYSIDIRFITTSITRRNPDTWYFKKAEAGGGILNWLGCHWIDLMRYLTGSEVTKVSALEANVSGAPIDVEDAASVSFQFANGMIGTLHTGYYTAGDNELSIGLRGSEGWSKWELGDDTCTIKSTHPDWAGAPLRRFSMTSPTVPGYGAEGRALIKAFAASMRTPNAPAGSSGYRVADAIKSLQIIEAAHESAAHGRTVTL